MQNWLSLEITSIVLRSSFERCNCFSKGIHSRGCAVGQQHFNNCHGRPVANVAFKWRAGFLWFFCAARTVLHVYTDTCDNKSQIHQYPNEGKSYQNRGQRLPTLRRTRILQVGMHQVSCAQQKRCTRRYAQLEGTKSIWFGAQSSNHGNSRQT